MNADHTLAAYIIVAAITSHFDYNSDNYYKRVKGWHTAKLFYPIAQRIASNNRMIAHGLDPYRPKFYGTHPLTGLPITIIFNEPAPSRQNVMSWNPLIECWFYSEDAGLTWQRVEDSRFGEFAVKCDALINEPTRR